MSVVTLSLWKICLPAYLTSCPHSFVPQVLIWEDLLWPEKGLEAFLRAEPWLGSAIQDETLTRPVGDYMIFIDGRNVSLLSTLFRAKNKSDINVSLVVSLFWICFVTHRSLDATGLSPLISILWKIQVEMFFFCIVMLNHVYLCSVKLSMRNL